jgi:hypothetical protein
MHARFNFCTVYLSVAVACEPTAIRNAKYKKNPNNQNPKIQNEIAALRLHSGQAFFAVVGMTGKGPIEIIPA